LIVFGFRVSGLGHASAWGLAGFGSKPYILNPSTTREPFMIQSFQVQIGGFRIWGSGFRLYGFRFFAKVVERDAVNGALVVLAATTQPGCPERKP
jgi:hypothetical protein